jgi:hypothetical protein
MLKMRQVEPVRGRRCVPQLQPSKVVRRLLGKVMNVSDEPTSRHERDAKLAGLHDRLISSVEAMVSRNDWTRSMEFAARFRSRSFNNTLLIWAQHSAAHERGTVPAAFPSYVAGFRHWHSLGRHVIAGQKGYMIFAPVTARFATSSPANVSSWRKLSRNERPRAGELVRQRMIGSRPAYVWDISQTDGSPIAERPLPKLLAGEAPAGLRDGLSTLVQDAGYTLRRVPDAAALGGANGQTDFAGQTVSVHTDMDAAAQVKTLGHELAHIRMHDSSFGALLNIGIREVEAESVALMIGASHGMDTSNYSIPYVSSWASSVANKTATEVVQETGERVRRAAVAILDQLQTDQVGTGEPPDFERTGPLRSLATGPNASPALQGRRLGARSLS